MSCNFLRIIMEYGKYITQSIDFAILLLPLHWFAVILRSSAHRPIGPGILNHLFLLLFGRLSLPQPIFKEIEVLLEQVLAVRQRGICAFLFWDSVQRDSIRESCVLESEWKEDPIEDVVILITFSDQFFFEETFEVIVVWVFLVFQVSAVLHERQELLWQAFAEVLDGCFLHDLADLFPSLFGVGIACRLIPRQLASQEVNKHQSKGFQIVSSGMSVAFEDVKTGVSESADVSIVGVDDIWSWFVGRCVMVRSAKGVVDCIDLLKFLPQSDQEVAWLDVPMHKIFVVDELKTREYLVCNHQNCLQTEPSPAQLQIILQRIPQQLSNEKVEVSILTSPQQVRNTNASLYLLKHFPFIDNKTRPNSLGLALDRTISITLHVSSRVDGGKLAFVQFVLEPIPTAYPDLQRAHLNIMGEQWHDDQFRLRLTAQTPETMFSRSCWRYCRGRVCV